MSRVKSKKYAGVYLNKLENGDISYSIIYKDNIGKTCRVTIGKKSNGITEIYAYNKRNEIINQMRLGEQPDVVKRKKKYILLFDEMAQMYFDDKALHNKNNEHEKRRYNNHIKAIFGKKDISSITLDDLVKFQQEKSKQLSSRKRPLSPKTVNNIIALFSAIFNYTIKKKNLKISNPVSQLEKFKLDNERERYLSKKEISLLMKHVKNNELLYLFCLLSLSTGARLESVMLIKKQDINLKQGTIILKDTKIKDLKKSTYRGYITKELHTVLEQKLPHMQNQDHLVSLDNGKQMKNAQLRERLVPILDKLYNKNLASYDSKNRVVVHTFRHTFASHLAINKTPIYTIMKLLNHQDIKSTLRYAKLAEDSGQDMVMQLYQ